LENKTNQAKVTEVSEKLNTVKKPNDYFIVGIGASAGGLSALELFFSNMPTDNFINMAFVIVQHLDPNHKSLLSEIIQRYTRMKVYEVEDAMQVQLNCVYIIPPTHDLRISNRVLYLVEPASKRNKHFPIDLFFNYLANDQQSHAVGIIFSGTGHDGTEGIKAIKEVGGIVIVQNPASCEFEGMPNSAISTGMVDDILAPNEMPRQLMNYLSGCYRNHLITSPTTYDEVTLKKIFGLLQRKTNNDFSMYKSSTIERRIERRLAVNRIEAIQEYYAYLQRSDNEVHTLFDDLLIGVTNFFRDPEVFLSLEKNVIPKLFEGKSYDDIIRVWIAGCSTGEEAYSIAILIVEHMQKIKQNFTVQIFATDIDATAIATARLGVYSLDNSSTISQERIKQHFVKDSGINNYRIHKSIRDMLIFSIHNIIKDPPFSRLDFISCRNLLIYMNTKLQQKIISTFHYALIDHGILLLGNSETLGGLANLYTVLDPKSKLFQSKKNINNLKQSLISGIIPINQIQNTVASTSELTSNIRLPLRELTENAILKQIALSGVLVDEQGDILYIHGSVGMYLELPSGEVDKNNILKMARKGLRTDLTLAFYNIKRNKQIVRMYGLQVKTNNHYTMVNFTISKINIDSKLKSEVPLYLILFEEDLDSNKENLMENKSLVVDTSNQISSDENLYIKSLKRELQLQKEFLQDTNEKLVTSNEELKSFNEEIQSMNEELQSTNEELETSKEELQSVNEELTTVNAELNIKITDLSRANNDMNNLLAGTGIGTIFVDHNLNIMRFTPAVAPIINLILSDIGRPIGHIVSNILGYNSLVSDIQAVLNTLISKEIEVITSDSRSYLMKIQPYRTLENVIEGAVISFVDITELSDMRKKLKKVSELSRLAIVARDSSDAIIVQDLKGKIIAWNSGAKKLYGWSEDEALNMDVKKRIPIELREKYPNIINELSNSTVLEPIRTQRLSKNGTVIKVNIISSALIDNHGDIYAIATTERPEKI
jgi:two-component system, chemotaxis family, CheB/CheR fusion protein